MNRRDRRREARRQAAGAAGANSSPKAEQEPQEYSRIVIGGAAEDGEALFAGAVPAIGATVVRPLGPRSDGDAVPEQIFVAVVPDDCPSLAPLFAARGVGQQRWTIAGQLGWSSAMSIGDESPARVALKLILTEPVPIDAKILFFPAQTGHALVVAAEGGWMALMTERAWQMVVELAPEGGTFADLVGRAVIFEMKPSAALPGFLATLDDLGPPLP